MDNNTINFWILDFSHPQKVHYSDAVYTAGAQHFNAKKGQKTFMIWLADNLNYRHEYQLY